MSFLGCLAFIAVFALVISIAFAIHPILGWIVVAVLLLKTL